MTKTRLADDIESFVETKKIQVQVSYEVVKLFSEQLYASPVKAIEELVVNSWDAEAKDCSVLVDLDGDRPLIAVFDSGKGMSQAELENLWHIGISNKQTIKGGRKQIGKFGIGKLASYAVARRATYVSRTLDGIYAVSIDFEAFAKATDKNGLTKPVQLSIRRVPSLDELKNSKTFASASAVLDVKPTPLDLTKIPTWTLVVLEDLKEKAKQLGKGRLRWVLETAMPLASDFSLSLNGERIESSKGQYQRVVEFSVADLETDRLTDLGAVTGETWTKTTEGLASPSFPAGVSGTVFVTQRSLYAEGGKSEDLGRSHGFFVRVHNRLINETDPLFGARPLSFTTWYRFAAIIEAPDLNQFITASRDDIEQSDVKATLRELLIQLFNQARDRFEALEAKKAAGQKKEGSYDYVGTDLLERPLADVLVAETSNPSPSERGVETGYRLIEPVADIAALQELVEQLYASERTHRKYTFKYSPAGPNKPIVRLDVPTATFTLNEDHELVREFSEKPDGKRLLEALAVAEALLEVYLHAAHIAPEITQDLLDRRDTLLRSLALDESYSLVALAAALRGSSDKADDLEIALVGALRALGFSARHVGGAGDADGLARYTLHGVDEKSFTLEAKSSGDVPSLPQLDFAGLRSHYEANSANGCLLVAPSYPNANNPDGEVSKRALQQKVSCWTVEQLAKVVESAEKRHVNARKIQDIVLKMFTPQDVAMAIDSLLSEPTFDKTELYDAVLEALQNLEKRLSGTARNVSMVATEVSRETRFQSISVPQVRDAVEDLAKSSRGMLLVTEKDEVFVLGVLDELRRRVSAMTSGQAPPRRLGTFRNGTNGNEEAK